MLRTTLPLPSKRFAGSGKPAPCRKHSVTRPPGSTSEKIASEGRSLGPKPITSQFEIVVDHFDRARNELAHFRQGPAGEGFDLGIVFREERIQLLFGVDLRDGWRFRRSAAWRFFRGHDAIAPHPRKRLSVRAAGSKVPEGPLIIARQFYWRVYRGVGPTRAVGTAEIYVGIACFGSTVPTGRIPIMPRCPGVETPGSRRSFLRDAFAGEGTRAT